MINCGEHRMTELDCFITKLCRKTSTNYSLLFLLFEFLIVILLIVI